MGDIVPEEILKFDFTPGIEIGFLPQQATWGTTSLMKMGFLPKQGTSFLPYSPQAVVVKGESPPVVVPVVPVEESKPSAPTTKPTETTSTSPPATTTTAVTPTTTPSQTTE